MSDTPRTDKREYTDTYGSGPVVGAGFARDLERENEELKKLVEQMTRALPWARTDHSINVIKAAIDAAKGE
jgi:hypothetical protein